MRFRHELNLHDKLASVLTPSNEDAEQGVEPNGSGSFASDCGAGWLAVGSHWTLGQKIFP